MWYPASERHSEKGTEDGMTVLESRLCIYPTTQQFHSWVFVQRNENVSTKTLCKNIHGSFTDISSQLETTQMFINSLMAIKCGLCIQWNTAQQ